MPKLIRLYLASVAIGFALSAVFLGLLVWLDIAGLGGLVLQSASGGVAALMLFVMNGIVFSGVQFAIAISRLADDDTDDDDPRGGHHARGRAFFGFGAQPSPVPVKIPVKIHARPTRKPRAKPPK
jgi:hypothetical protein